jgi:hypothetical protein
MEKRADAARAFGQMDAEHAESFRVTPKSMLTLSVLAI